MVNEGVHLHTDCPVQVVWMSTRAELKKEMELRKPGDARLDSSKTNKRIQTTDYDKKIMEV